MGARGTGVGAIPRPDRPRCSDRRRRTRPRRARGVVTFTIAQVGERADAILGEVERAVVGKRAAATLVLAGLLADGHVLIEDVPGLAKTLLARSLAAATTLELRRVQFTPDLMPADLTGSSVFDP